MYQRGKGKKKNQGPLQNHQIMFAYRKTSGNTTRNSVSKSNLNFPEIYCRTNAKMKLRFVLCWTQ